MFSRNVTSLTFMLSIASRRTHPYQEWFDLYQESSTTDLLKFFDYYLKDIKNDWPETPKVRLSLLNMGSRAPVINQAEEE